MEDLLRLLDSYGIPLVAIVVLGVAVYWIGTKLFNAMQSRIDRSEALFDKFQPSIDALTDATNEQTAALKTHTTVVNALLDELRRRP